MDWLPGSLMCGQRATLAVIWMDKCRDAGENLYSRHGRPGPVAAVFLIGPDVPECTRGYRAQIGLATGNGS